MLRVRTEDRDQAVATPARRARGPRRAGQPGVFLTDGGEDVRDLPRYLYPLSEHDRDWFHITMRITVLANTAKSLAPLPEVPDFAARIGADLERLKWLLWHGNTFRADQTLSRLDYVDDEAVDPLARAAQAGEVARQVRHPHPRQRTPHPELRRALPLRGSDLLGPRGVSGNQVVSKRTSKKQQMRDLAGHFQRWYPGFTHHGSPAGIEVDLAA